MAYTDKEIWKQIPLPKGSTTRNYAVSSHGRLASFDKDINDRLVLKMHDHEGYRVSTTRVAGKSKALFPHQLMGALFLKKHNPKCKFVIHLDYDKANNHISNLKWATPKELAEHTKKSPIVLKSIKHRIYTGNTAKKLNEKKVIQLKKEIWNPDRKLTLKQLANKYGIAEMNLYRIKVGEMWFHVHVDGEPMHDRYKTHLKNIEYHEKLNAKEQVQKDKKETVKLAKLKKSAEKRKKLDAEKKQRLLERIAKAKQKEKARKETDIRVAKRNALTEKRKQETAKKQATFVKKQIELAKKKLNPKNKKKASTDSANKGKKAGKKNKKEKKNKKNKKK